MSVNTGNASHKALRPKGRCHKARVLRSKGRRTRYQRIMEVGRNSEEHKDAYRMFLPPKPPLVPTPAMATDPKTSADILWLIAREHPGLRRWLAANPRATPALLEAVSQLGGPGVRHSLEILLDNP